MKRRSFVGAAALAVVPQFVPYAPGGSTDTSSRIIAERQQPTFIPGK